MIWKKRYKILIVDDEPDTVEFISINLSERYKCIKAFNGKDAISKVEAEMPDLIILDTMMPVLNGWNTLKILKHRAKTKHIPVIMCTAKQSMGDVEQSFTLGAAAYIIKPIELDILNQKVDEVLKGR